MDLGAHWPLLSLRNMLVLVLTVFVLVSGQELNTTAVSDGTNTTATESTTIVPSSTSEASTPPSSTEASSTTMVTTSVTTAVTSDTTSPSTMMTTASVASTTDISNTSAASSNMTERTGSGRAINLEEQMSTSPEKGSLQDLSLDDIEEPTSNMTTSSPAPSTTDNPSSSTTSESVTNVTISLNGTKCVEPGREVNTGCNEKCECGSDGHLVCESRCPAPQLQRSVAVRTLDPACTLRPVEDPCCALLVCTQADTETEPLEGCVYKNETHQRGDTFMDGCGTVCTCGEAGHVSCKSRCPPVTNNSTSDRCVALPDPTDPCCTVVLCDVTLGDHDVSKQGVEEPSTVKHLQVLTAELVNQTAVRLVLEPQQDNVTVESSLDQVTWQRQESNDLLVTGLKPGTTYYLRAKVGSLVSNAVQVSLPDKETGSNMSGCTYKGKHYGMGDEFHDGCEAFCACTDTGVQCATIECPTDFGLDVLDPTCVSWEMHPADFTPTPPNCCPDHVRCRDNGSCIYEGEQYPNWAEIPMKITGCDKRCYCEFGNITCQSTCPPVDKEPPTNLACPPSAAVLNHLPGDDCCLYWMCPQQPLHTGFAVPPPHPGFGPQHSVGRQDEITVQTLEAIDDSTVRLVFSVPPVLVGLHGRVELRYTADKQNMDPSTWLQQVFAPPGDLIATPQLEFELGDLQPDTVYNIKVTLNLRDLHNSPSSPILSVRTLPRAVPVTTLPPQIPIDVAFTVEEVNSTWAKLIWRKFSEFELQFIDGVQLRYKEKEGKVYLATPLIHRSVTSYTLEGLRPLTQYEVGIFFIPFPGQTTELMSEHGVQLITGVVSDPYKFNITLEVSHIKSTSVELNWSGVPYPEDKYVNVYRAIYQSDAGKEDFSSFKIAKRDAPSKTMIQDLKPGTRYRLWLEVYLTNGRIKKSNVQDFITKPGAVPAVGATQQGQLKGGSHIEPIVEASDYYGPLVAVAIIAALAILAALILLLILMRKHGTNKAAISASRKTQSAYDNPSYKVEIQQETMDL